MGKKVLRGFLAVVVFLSLGSLLSDNIRILKSETAWATSIASLIRILENPNKSGDAAIEPLIQIGEPAVPAVIRTLENTDPSVFENLVVKLRAVKILSKIGDKRAVPTLLNTMRGENLGPGYEIPLGIYVSSALTNIGTPGVPALIDALEDDDKRVRYYAVGALGCIGDERAIPALTKLLEDRNRQVREVAKEALNKIKSKAPEHKEYSPSKEPVKPKVRRELTPKEEVEIKAKMLFTLGQNFEMNRMNDKAIEQYQKIIESYPDSPYAKSAEQRINELKSK